MLSDKEIYNNRLTWIEFLMRPETKKAVSVLDNGDGSRCCLGHGCFVLGIQSKVNDEGHIEYDGETGFAPQSFMEMVGLHGTGGAPMVKFFDNKKVDFGMSLAYMNDETVATPQEIGEYLKSVIMGGWDTPFRGIKIDV